MYNLLNEQQQKVAKTNKFKNYISFTAPYILISLQARMSKQLFN